MFPYVFAAKDREKVSMRRSGWRNCAEVENIEAEVVDNDTAEDARIKLRGVSGRGEPSLNHRRRGGMGSKYGDRRFGCRGHGASREKYESKKRRYIREKEMSQGRIDDLETPFTSKEMRGLRAADIIFSISLHLLNFLMVAEEKYSCYL